MCFALLPQCKAHPWHSGAQRLSTLQVEIDPLLYLMPESIGSIRSTRSTSSVRDMRGASFEEVHANIVKLLELYATARENGDVPRVIDHAAVLTKINQQLYDQMIRFDIRTETKDTSSCR